MSTIAVICDTLPFTHDKYSGAEICCEYMAKNKYNDDNVVYITSKIDKLPENGEVVHELPDSHSKDLMIDPQIVIELLLIFKKVKPDKVHLFTKKYLIASVFACRIMEIFITYSVVDYHIICKNNTLKRSDGSLCDNRIGFYCKIRQIWFDMIIDYIDEFLTFTNISKKRMIQWGIPEDKISVLYQYETPKVFGKKKLRFDQIVFVGSVFPHKGVDVVIKSIPLVKDKYPDAELIIIGGGAESYIDEMQKLINDLGLYQDVFMYGPLKHETVLKYINGAYVVVVAEQWYSDFGPIVLYEAVKLGRNVVAGDLGAGPEFTDNIVKYNDPIEYAEKIIEVLDKYVEKK